MKFEPSNCISARLGILQRKISSIYRKYLTPLDVTESQSSILLVIDGQREIGQSEIATVLNLERSSLSRNMVRLEKNGWIIRDASYHPIWKLTDNGTAFLRKLLPAWEKAMSEVDSLIGRQGWDSFARFERKLK